MIKEGTYQESEISWYRPVDFGVGEWNDEPDKATWVDDDTDLDCMIVRNHFGALCGYVGVDKSHPMYGKAYSDIPWDEVEVHGGLTYAAACQEDGNVCHVPLLGRDHDIWWFGFDCGHAFDTSPGVDQEMIKAGIIETGAWKTQEVYRNWEYVTGEVTNLASQLKELE